MDVIRPPTETKVQVVDRLFPWNIFQIKVIKALKEKCFHYYKL